MYLAWTIGTAALAGYGVMTALWQPMLIAGISGATFMLGQVIWTSLLQELVPRELLGRVSSVDWLVSVGLVPVSFALTGPISGLVGSTATMVGGGLFAAAVTIALPSCPASETLSVPARPARAPMSMPSPADAARRAGRARRPAAARAVSAPPPLRVVLVAETALPYVSGVTVATDALARGLGAAGHGALLLAPAPATRGFAPRATVQGPAPAVAWLPSLQLPPPAPAGYRVPQPGRGVAATRTAIAFAPHVVHVQSPFGAGLVGRRAARRLGVPLVFTHHTRYRDYRHYLGLLSVAGGGMLERWLAAFWQSCDAVIAPGSDLAAEIRARLGPRSRTSVVTIPTGIDVAAIHALEVADPRVAAGWPPDAIVAATLGRLAPEKSVDVLLDAVAAGPSVRLAVVGDGGSGAALRAGPAGRTSPGGCGSPACGRGTRRSPFSAAPTCSASPPRRRRRDSSSPRRSPPGCRSSGSMRPAFATRCVRASTASSSPRVRGCKLPRGLPRRSAPSPTMARAATRMAAAAAEGASRFDLVTRIGEVVDLYRSAIARRR